MVQQLYMGEEMYFYIQGCKVWELEKNNCEKKIVIS